MKNTNQLPQQLSDKELQSLSSLLVALAKSEECSDECDCNKMKEKKIKSNEDYI